MKNIEKMISPKVMLVVGLILGVLCAITGAWNYVEPMTGIATLAVAGAIWFQTRKAAKAVYADNGDGSWVVALEVGRPVSEAVKKQFGQLDAYIKCEEVIKGNTLVLPEHYEALTKAVYAAVCQGQGKNIHLVMSGPIALSVLVGQLVGLMHFQITVYQYVPSSGTYEPVPRPTRDWLEHRG